MKTGPMKSSSIITGLTIWVALLREPQPVILNSMEGAEQALFRAMVTPAIWDICTQVLPKLWMDYHSRGHDDIIIIVAVEEE